MVATWLVDRTGISHSRERASASTAGTAPAASQTHSPRARFRVTHVRRYFAAKRSIGTRSWTVSANERASAADFPCAQAKEKDVTRHESTRSASRRIAHCAGGCRRRPRWTAAPTGDGSEGDASASTEPADRAAKRFARTTVSTTAALTACAYTDGADARPRGLERTARSRGTST